MIELKNVTKLYKNVIGVNDLNIQLDGAAYGLIGPNGSGKTTLINLLIGQFQPTLGTVRVFGQNPSFHRRVLSRIGLCPASDVLYSNVSAIEWVTYQVRLHGFTRRESRQRAERALATVGMSHAMKRHMGTYSLGMRQRTKIAQAIAHDPDLLILDEPYNGLDPVGRAEMTAMLKTWAAQGRGLLFASHVLQEIQSITSSFLLIHGGRLLASGTAGEIGTILSETPQQVRVIGDDVRKLIPRLAEVEWVHSFHLVGDGRELRMTLHDAGAFQKSLPKWIAEQQLSIDRLSASDSDLDAIFESLLRHHRGESE